MKAGTVFHAPQFKCLDSTVQNKLAVVLSDGRATTCVTVKTTSKRNGRSLQMGCHLDDRFPNFFLPVEYSGLDKDTWICLDEFHEFSSQEVIEKQFSQKWRFLTELPPEITKALITCALEAEDLTGYQAEDLNETLATL
uniref:Uncharacterized protein n=1 Tax=Magnetococcus massalia (strain MO-1) TaxID=451514 RepID=A0A1S7LFX7_MAGMO|nr:conserved protein of unknown function [Candidatus Magnetococcus massalia]